MKFALHAVGCGSTARPEMLAQVARKAEGVPPAGTGSNPAASSAAITITSRGSA